MKKIKILVDARWFDSYYSGVSTYIKGIYNALAEDPTFEITFIGSDEEKLRKEFPVHVKFILHQSSSNFKRLFFDIPRIIKKHKFDYAHFQYISPFNKTCRYIVTLHDILFVEYRKAFPLKFIIQNTILFYLSAKSADILLTVSEYSKRRISKVFRISEEKISVTNNGVLNSFYEKNKVNKFLQDKGYNRYLLYVSRLEPRKNHIILLKAFVELGLYNKYKLVFIGKKTIEVNELFDYYNNLLGEIKEAVVFIENTSEEDLYRFYAGADLFVYPSLSEGFGIPPIEAIACGAKTICSNTTALSDFDFFGKYHFNPSDLKELKQKIISTLDDDRYPLQLFQSIIKNRYSWKRIATDFKQVLINDNLQAK